MRMEGTDLRPGVVREQVGTSPVGDWEGLFLWHSHTPWGRLRGWARFRASLLDQFTGIANTMGSMDLRGRSSNWPWRYCNPPCPLFAPAEEGAEDGVVGLEFLDEGLHVPGRQIHCWG